MYRKFLDPSLTQVEKCLVRRAEALEAGAEAAGRDDRAAMMLFAATEFRALAGELHEL